MPLTISTTSVKLSLHAMDSLDLIPGSGSALLRIVDAANKRPRGVGRKEEEEEEGWCL